MFGTFEKCNILFLHIAYKIFTVSIEHLFPFNWSFWLFIVGMAVVGLCELSWNEVLDFKALSKIEYFRRESVDHFFDEDG